MSIPTIFSFENNAVRTLGAPESPLFVAVDICSSLGYANSSKAIKDHVDPEDLIKSEIIDKLNRIQSTVATVSLAVDLPEEFKGTHMSRFVEALHQHGPLLDVHTALAIPRELPRHSQERPL